MSKQKQKVGEKLQQKADNLKDEKIREALLKTNIKGLTRQEAFKKLLNAIEDASEKV